MRDQDVKPPTKTKASKVSLQHWLLSIGFILFLAGSGYFLITKVIFPPQPVENTLDTKVTLKKTVVYKTITTNTTDVSAVDRILAHKSKAYLARVTNLKQYRVESTLLDNHTWLLTLHRKDDDTNKTR